MTRAELAEEFDTVKEIEVGLKGFERVPAARRISEVFALFLEFIASVLPLFYEPTTKKWSWPLNPLAYLKVIREVWGLLRGVLGRHTD